MKLLLQLALLLMFCHHAGQKAVFFGQNRSTGSGGSAVVFGGCQDAGSGSCTVTSVPSGAFAMVAIYNLNTATATLAATSNTPVERSGDPFVHTSGSPIQDQLWTIKNMTGGNITFAYSFSSGASFPIMYVIIVTGASLTSPVDAQTPNATVASVEAFSAPFTCGNITTSANNELIISSIDFDNGGSLTAGSGFTAINLNGSSGSEWGIAVTAGANTVGYNLNNSADAMCEVMAVH